MFDDLNSECNQQKLVTRNSAHEHKRSAIFTLIRNLNNPTTFELNFNVQNIFLPDSLHSQLSETPKIFTIEKEMHFW
jgi:hypothetical protein